MYTVFNILTALMWSHAAVWGIDQIYTHDNNSILSIAVLFASAILAGMQVADLLRNIEDKHNQGVL
jgi:hypothetical protein